MVLETSALVAVLTEESGYVAYLDQMMRAGGLLVSAGTVYEAAVVLYGRSGRLELVRKLLDLLAELKVQVIAFDERSAWAAFDAYCRFGRGFHPARLNLMDCVSYQLAHALGQPLLFKGDDFGQTDVRAAI